MWSHAAWQYYHNDQNGCTCLIYSKPLMKKKKRFKLHELRARISLVTAPWPASTCWQLPYPPLAVFRRLVGCGGPRKVHQDHAWSKTLKFRDFYPNRFDQFLSEIGTMPSPPKFYPNSVLGLKKVAFFIYLPFPAMRAAFSMSTSIVETAI